MNALLAPRTWALGLALLGLVPALGSCGCADAGLCRIAPEGGAATAFRPTASYAPGTATRVKLQVSPISIGPADHLTLGTNDPAVRALGPLVVAAFDGGRVRVIWDGVPFTMNNAYVTVTVDEDARLTGRELEDCYVTAGQIYLGNAKSATGYAGGVILGILVNPGP